MIIIQFLLDGHFFETHCIFFSDNSFFPVYRQHYLKSSVKFSLPYDGLLKAFHTTTLQLFKVFKNRHTSAGTNSILG